MASQDVLVRVLDGHDTIGGSKILVGWGGNGVFLDFGINYSHYGRYFEEYVKPRSTFGVADYWKLGLVPQIRGLYRGDVVPPGLGGGVDLPVKRVQGVLVSHAHLDHAGLIGLLDARIPLVASRTTAAILKAVQDSGKSDIFQQSVYMNRLRATEVGGQSVLKADASTYVGRDCFLTDGAAPPAFSRFWGEPPTRDGKKSKTLEPGRLDALASTTLDLPSAAFTVDHSVLGSTGFVLESPQGAIAYTGDIRTHGEQAPGTRRFFDSLKRHKPWILLAEGTQVRPRAPEVEALAGPTTEEEVEANCRAAVDRFRGQLVVADFAPRNIERLKAFERIARAAGRRLVIVPKDAYLLHAMHAAEPAVPVPNEGLLVFDPPAGTEAGWERFVLHEYGAFHVSTQEIRAAPGDYILAFSYWDVKHLLDIEPPRGAYIYSSSEAFSEEQEIDMERLHHWLTYFHLEPVGFHMVPGDGKRHRLKPHFVAGFHSSGHMPGEEILDWIAEVQPDHVIPVHTDARGFFLERLEALGVKTLREGLG